MGTNDEKRKKWVNRCWVNPNGQWIKSQLTWSLHKIGKYIFFSRAKWGTEIDDLFVYLQSTDNLSNASEPSATKPPFGELVCVSEWVCFIIMQHVCNLSRSVRCQIELKTSKKLAKNRTAVAIRKWPNFDIHTQYASNRLHLNIHGVTEQVCKQRNRYQTKKQTNTSEAHMVSEVVWRKWTTRFTSLYTCHLSWLQNSN